MNPAGHPADKSGERFYCFPGEFVDIVGQIIWKGENICDQVDDIFLPIPRPVPSIFCEQMEAT